MLTFFKDAFILLCQIIIRRLPRLSFLLSSLKKLGAFQYLKKKTKIIPLSKYRYLATILEGHPLPFSTPYDFW